MEVHFERYAQNTSSLRVAPQFKRKSSTTLGSYTALRTPHWTFASMTSAYAPAPYGWAVPTSRLSASINLDEEVTFSSLEAEAEMHETLADIFGLLITLDKIERAFLKDSISESAYAETCSRLLKQYKAYLSDEATKRAFGDLESFKRDFEVRESSRFVECMNMKLICSRSMSPWPQHGCVSASPQPSKDPGSRPQDRRRGRLLRSSSWPRRKTSSPYLMLSR